MGGVINATLRPHYPGKDPVPIIHSQEAGWAPGTVWTGAENLAPTGVRSPDRPARSESLYRLSYPGPYVRHKSTKVIGANRQRHMSAVSPQLSSTNNLATAQWLRLAKWAPPHSIDACKPLGVSRHSGTAVSSST